MRDCRQGKIDRILVKSVSRFARNAQDCIEAVRELRQLGVTVYFEKEHINTANMSNEMFLSMMSAFAQEESISIMYISSGNALPAIRKQGICPT